MAFIIPSKFILGSEEYIIEITFGHVLEAYMLHMNNCTHSACVCSAHLMCLYVAYMWRVSIFVYSAHMKKRCLICAARQQVCMQHVCSMFVVSLQHVCSMYVVSLQHVCSMYVVSLQHVCSMYVVSLQHVCSMYVVSLQHVCSMYVVSLQHVCSMYVVSLQHVCSMYVVSLQHVCSMYVVSLQHVCSMYVVSLQHVCSMYFVCVLYVCSMCALYMPNMCSEVGDIYTPLKMGCTTYTHGCTTCQSKMTLPWVYRKGVYVPSRVYLSK